MRIFLRLTVKQLVTQVLWSKRPPNVLGRDEGLVDQKAEADAKRQVRKLRPSCSAGVRASFHQGVLGLGLIRKNNKEISVSQKTSIFYVMDRIARASQQNYLV